MITVASGPTGDQDWRRLTGPDERPNSHTLAIAFEMWLGKLWIPTVPDQPDGPGEHVHFVEDQRIRMALVGRWDSNFLQQGGNGLCRVYFDTREAPPAHTQEWKDTLLRFLLGQNGGPFKAFGSLTPRPAVEAEIGIDIQLKSGGVGHELEEISVEDAEQIRVRVGSFGDLRFTPSMEGLRGPGVPAFLDPGVMADSSSSIWTDHTLDLDNFSFSSHGEITRFCYNWP